VRRDSRCSVGLWRGSEPHPEGVRSGPHARGRGNCLSPDLYAHGCSRDAMRSDLDAPAQQSVFIPTRSWASRRSPAV
jgi:hypothetical protein